MVKNIMDSYAHAMRQVGREQASYDNIARAVDCERQRGSDTAHARPWAPHHALRLAAMAACAGLLVLGGASILPHVMGGSASAPNASADGFVLAAYAEGSPIEGKTGIVSTDNLILDSGSWSGSPDSGFEVQYIIDPSVAGDGVASLEYRSTNENVKLEGHRDRALVQPGESLGTPYLTSFTVGGTGATLPDLHQLDLRVTTSANDKIDACYGQATGGAGQDAWDLLGLEIERAAAEELASGTLEITATFEDGHTETHVYRIIPVEDFDEVWGRNKTAANKAYETGAEYVPEQLYALEQVK